MPGNLVFVFGSNLAGVHGAGAAAYALKNEGAVWGDGLGRQGNSYAIPTKDEYIRTLPLHVVQVFIYAFICYAKSNPNEVFKVTRIGCGLAGFEDKEIAPNFIAAPENCIFDVEWKQFFPDIPEDKFFSFEEPCKQPKSKSKK